MISKSRALLCFLSAATALLSSAYIMMAKAGQQMDGFFAYCTSNLDGTGSCTNEEDNREFTCIIVPGAIISCPAKRKSASVDCVWISNVYANQAQFWCDKEAEEAMYLEDSPLEKRDIQENRKKPSSSSPQNNPIETFDNSF